MAQPKRVDIAHVIDTQTNRTFSASIAVLCCIVLMVDGFDNQAINYTSAAIIRDWGIDRVLFTPVFWSNLVGWMVGTLLFSMIADRIGRRKAMIVATLFFSGATYAMAFTTNLYELIVFKFLSSVGVGGAMPMAIAMIADYTPRKRRALMITALFLGYSAGSSGGGFIAAELILTQGWEAIFQLGGIVGLIVTGLLVVTLPESVRYLLVQGAPQEKIQSYVRRMKPKEPIEPGTEFYINEQKKQAGVPLRYLFTDGRSAITFFLWFALGFSFVTHFFISNWLPILLADYMPLDQVNRVKAVFQMGGAFGFIFGLLIDRYGVPVVTVAKLVGAIPVAMIGVALTMEAGPAILVITTLASGIFVLGGTAGINALSGMIYPTFVRSTATGAAFAAARIGGLLGPSLGGLLIWLQVPVLWMFIIGAIPMVLSGLCAFGLSRKVDVLYERKAPHTEHESEAETPVTATPASARL